MPPNDLKKMAEWIVTNKDKKDSPEFATVSKALKQAYEFAQSQPKPLQYPDPTEGMSGIQKFLAGAGKAMVDIGRGVGDITGYYSDEEIDRFKERDQPLMETGAGTAGNIAGNVAAFMPTALIPGANTVTGAALTGATIGALQPTGKEESRLTNIGVGTLGGAIGSKVAGVFNPKVDPRVQALMSEGVTPTPGQVMGGAARDIESMGKSVPVLRSFIQGAEERTVQQFNAAAINRAITPISGTKVREGGHEALESAYNQISDKYDEILPRLKVVMDDEFSKDMDTVINMTYSMTDDAAKIFDRVITRDVLDKFTTAGRMSGQSMKNIESVLGQKASQYMRSPDPSHRELGQAFRETQRLLRGLTERSNPQHQGQLRKINTAYANLLRVERAGSAVGAKEGVFTPSQLKSAVKALDPSKGKRQTAQGKALMQDLAEAGKTVLSDTLPDSGTPIRMAGLASGLSGFVNPLTGGGAAIGLTGYNPVSQKAIAALLAQRPEISKRIGRGIEKYVNPYAAALGAPAALEYSR